MTSRGLELGSEISTEQLVYPRPMEPDQLIIGTSSSQALGDELDGFAADATAAWPAANLAIFVPFRISGKMTVVKMYVFKGNTANGNVDIGIYDTSGNRLVSLGSTVDGGASSVRTLDIADTDLTRGTYYMAYATDSSTGTYGRWATGGNQPFDVGEQTSAFPLPDPATISFTMARNYIPHIGVSARVLVS